MKQLFLFAGIILLFSDLVLAQSYKEDQYPRIHVEEWEKMNRSKEKTFEWFEEARFEMFIHWGFIPSRGESGRVKRYMTCGLLMWLNGLCMLR